jgi:hypothetical protein
MECAMPRAVPTIPRDGLRLGDAMRKYGPPELVARLDALFEEREVVRNLEMLRRRPWDQNEVNPKAGVERDVVAVLRSLWANLKSKLVAGELVLTWQPSDPTAERQRLAADRCARLAARISIEDSESRVFLSSHVLDDVHIHTAQTETPSATAEVADTGEVTAHLALPMPPGSEFIDLSSEPPHLPRYSVNGPFGQATLGDMDDCIKKIAELDGGRTNRDTMRKWGRYWLRTVRNVDTTQDALVRRFSEPEHDIRRRPDGGDHPRNAGATRERHI